MNINKTVGAETTLRLLIEGIFFLRQRYLADEFHSVWIEVEKHKDIQLHYTVTK